jgi:hypothetical protein
MTLAAAVKDAHTKAALRFNHVMLRLNPGEKDQSQRELGLLMEKTREALTSRSYDVVVTIFPELREKTRLVLKAEWVRVKVGEPTYRWSKRAVMAFLLIGLALGGFFVFKFATFVP